MKEWFTHLRVRSKLALTYWIAFGLVAAVGIIGYVSQSLTVHLLAVCIAAGVTLIIGTTTTRLIASPLEKALAKVKELSTGSPGPLLDVASHDEVGEISNALNRLSEGWKSLATQIEGAAHGVLPGTISGLGEGDELASALKRLVAVLNGLNAQMKVLKEAGGVEEFSRHSGATALEGIYRDIYDNVKTTLSEVTAPLASALDSLDRLEGNGRLSMTVQRSHGDYRAAQQRLSAWIDGMNALLTDTRMISEAVGSGKLSTRIRVENHKGTFRTIAEHMNAVLDAFDQPIQSLTGALTKLAEGDIPDKINQAYRGDFNTSADRLNGCIDAINTMKEEIRHALNRVADGDFAGRADTSRQKGEFQRIIEDLNNTVDGLVKPLKVFGESMGRIANGEIPPQVMEVYHGHVEDVKRSLNQWIETIGNLAADVESLSKAAHAGKLTVRAEAGRHHGEFRKIIEEINTSFDALTAPIREEVSVLTAMAEGDLSCKVEGEYRGDHQLMKDSINAVAESLAQALREVREAAEAVGKATDEITAGTEEIAAGAEEQHSQVAEVATATEEITRSITEISQSNGSASQTAKEAKEAARDGGRSVTETINGLRQMGGTIQNFATTVITLSSSSDQIGQIVNVIDDIADQTNLLSLNAAIEAARAGEEGRGFSVVADEVRKLAERTTKATREISAMIKNIQSQTTEAMNQMGHGVEDVELVIAQGERAEATLQGIVEVSEVISDILEQIAKSSEQQASASQQVSRSIEGMSAVTAQSAQRTQHIAGRSEELRKIAKDLRASIDRFRWADAERAHTPSEEELLSH